MTITDKIKERREALDTAYVQLEAAIMGDVIIPFCDKYHLVHLGGGDFGNGESLHDFFIHGSSYVSADWRGKRNRVLSYPVQEWLVKRGHPLDEFRDDLSAVYEVIHNSWSNCVTDVVSNTLCEEYAGSTCR